MASCGCLRVNEILPTFVASGADFEQGGAINVSRWARAPAEPAPSCIGGRSDHHARHALPSLREHMRPIHPNTRRWRRVLVRKPIENEDLDVRRGIVARGGFDPARCPADLMPPAGRARRLARDRPDEYISQWLRPDRTAFWTHPHRQGAVDDEIE